MEHRIVVIADDALPTIHDWALVETSREVIFAVKQSAMTADNLADGWAAYRMTNRLHAPHQRGLPDLARGAAAAGPAQP